MASKTLGVPGQVVTWITYLLLLYATIAAYMAGESSLIASLIDSIWHVQLPTWIWTISFSAILGTAVFFGTHMVDHCNRGLISVKGLSLLASLVLILPKVQLPQLMANQHIGQFKYMLVATPALLCIFNYHFVIPSLRMYIGKEPHILKWILIVGTTISMIIYCFWMMAISGTIPLTGEYSFTSLALLGHDVDAADLIKVLRLTINDPWVTTAISVFFNISMTTSFLGASLGLFDFLADGFKHGNQHHERLKTALLTFLPPLLFALFYPKGFMVAMNYSASCAAILCLILPALMAYSLRKQLNIEKPYRVFGGNWLLILLVVIGAVLFFLPILSNFNLLPASVYVAN